MRIGVVIPCFRVKKHIVQLLNEIGPEVSDIYVVDDCCPEGTADYLDSLELDQRVRLIRHAENQGVGGATLTGIKQALEDGVEVIVKLDGDGQMDPRLVPSMVQPIEMGIADFCKGNRFHYVHDVRDMPAVRLIGNAGLSFITKLSTGYWNLFDPTNGLFAIHADTARRLPFHRIASRYFFESDLLFRLGMLRACVLDIPMRAVYADEESSMQPFREIPRFLLGHSKNFFKRLVYNYFLRDFNLGSVQLILGALLVPFGFIFGIINWSFEGQPASAGTVMLAAMPVIVGVQLLLGFLNYDISNAPKVPLQKLIDDG